MGDARSGGEAVAAIAASGLVATGVYVGPGTGVGAALLATGALAVGAVMFVPIALLAIQRRRWGRAVSELLDRGLRARQPEQLGVILAEVHGRTGAGRASLVVPGHGGAIVVVSDSGQRPLEVTPEIEEAFSSLSAAAVPMARGNPGIEPLMATLGAAIAIPLIHRDLMVGVVGLGDRALTERPDYLESIRVIATVSLANTFLDREARSRGRLRELFGLAGEMQRSLAPSGGPDSIDLGGPVISSAVVAGTMKPMSECGGDVLAWRRTQAGELAVLIGDATGHGAAPALVAALVKGAFDAAVAGAGASLDPGELLGELDRQVTGAGAGSYQMSALVVVASGVGALRIASAGHCWPLVINARGIHPIRSRGGLLGSGAGPWKPLRVDVTAGDKLVAFTDGVVEAGAPVVAPLGERRLRAAVVAAASLDPRGLCEALLAEVERFLGGQEPADDVTAVVVEVVG